MVTLQEVYKQAAIKANQDGVNPADETQLTRWIYQNCDFRTDTLFFLVLGIGCELADIQAQEQGFQNDVARAYRTAQISLCFPEY